MISNHKTHDVIFFTSAVLAQWRGVPPYKESSAWSCPRSALRISSTHLTAKHKIEGDYLLYMNLNTSYNISQTHCIEAILFCRLTILCAFHFLNTICWTVHKCQDTFMWTAVHYDCPGLITTYTNHLKMYQQWDHTQQKRENYSMLQIFVLIFAPTHPFSLYFMALWMG